MNISNFQFLQPYDVQLVRLGTLAEHYFREDPNTCLIKLRQFGELLAQLTAAKSGFYNADETQAALLGRLKVERVLPLEVADLFHQVRLVGNEATHKHTGTHAEALTTLKIARQLAIWFHRTFGHDASFFPGPFLPPPDPAAANATLQHELAQLRAERDATRTEAERARLAAEEQQRLRLSAEETSRKERDERAIWEQLAAEAEQTKAALVQQLTALQTAAAQAPARQTAAIIAQAEQAATQLDLDESTTRALIDQQLRNQGWEADTKQLRYSNGTRPLKGRTLAIAEWPTANGPADYALFTGTQCIALVEAKRKSKHVSASIDQAERYSRAFTPHQTAEISGGPWGAYAVPFVFATNGRPYLKQLETESGIWFRDVRKASNHRRALNGWPTPDGLKDMLKVDIEAASADLANRPFDFGFPLRPYQKKAIETVETALATDSRTMLLAMATGTGKTKLAIALLYRLLAAKRFRRVCFVVDRSALGDQAFGEFSTTRIVSTKTFADIFGLKGLGDITIDLETKVHICTIQGLVKRVLYATEPKDIPPVDQYDLLVVDECHRGYLLDKEMSDQELGFRSEEDYISKYRRVLEHFDAVKIGLTATPALHTTQIFNKPIFTYSYREAVIDGYLNDHEPPIGITTALSQSGITFDKDAEIELLNPSTGEVDLAQVPDELHFEVESFNKRVITVAFNQVVAEELTKYIDPGLPGKTLIFAATDAHADIVVNLLKKAFAAAYGEIEDAAIRKITGSVDQVGKLIRSYRNDALPKIAVTVDLLTTGVDIPSITNLVFLRRVNSRILYEQMIGRATRLCPEIDKESFRIFDAVDLYPHLQGLTEMKPVVVNPAITLTQLFDEFTRAPDEEDRAFIRDQILVKLRKRLKKLGEEARQQYQQAAGETPEATLERFEHEPNDATADWLKSRSPLGALLDGEANGKSPTLLPISHHPDQVIAVTRGYGTAQKPEDFLEAFQAFVRDNLNKIAALTVVVQRPRELTRAQLRSLRLELDKLGYSEANLKGAWADAKNEDIAASIIGFVRQAALGDPLIPYSERVSAALRRILARHPWTAPQKQWLQRIGEQIEREIVLDRTTLDQTPFDAHGGFQRLDKIFNGQLEAVLADINEELWKKVAS